MKPSPTTSLPSASANPVSNPLYGVRASVRFVIRSHPRPHRPVRFVKSPPRPRGTPPAPAVPEQNTSAKLRTKCPASAEPGSLEAATGVFACRKMKQDKNDTTTTPRSANISQPVRNPDHRQRNIEQISAPVRRLFPRSAPPPQSRTLQTQTPKSRTSNKTAGTHTGSSGHPICGQPT